MDASGLKEQTDSGGLRERRRIRWKEEAIRGGLWVCASLSVVTTLAIMSVLVIEAIPFFQEVNPFSFLTGMRWTPLLEPRSFGVLPLVCGTTLIVVGSALICLPVGLACAIYLAEYSSDSRRSLIKPVLEILAGIPTVVYGYFALTFVTPGLEWIFPSTRVFNAASASIVVGIMVLPMVLRAVPQSLRQGAYALGATPFEVTTRVVVPASLSGVMASFVLAASRAIGETMAVTLAAGATPKMTVNPLVSIQTMTAYIVQVSLGDTPAGTVEYKTIFAAATLLFAITLAMNVFAHKVLRRFREEYE